MTNPTADLIKMLLSQGRSKGMPMNASPELIQYLAHAEAGTAPPQLRNLPSAQVFDPGGNLNPSNFGAGQRRIDHNPTYEPVDPKIMQELSDPNFPGPMDTVAPRTRPSTPATGESAFFIYGEKNGKRVKLDGPFPSMSEAQLEARRMQQSAGDTGYTFLVDL